jgi:hypothetical protein
VNKLLAHIISKPPDAPSEGTKANLSSRLGAKDLMKLISMSSFFVSCRQTIEAELLDGLSL